MGDALPTLIVDGYNVIFGLVPEAAAGAVQVREARLELERQLSRLATRDSLEIWVDYDGARVAGVLPETTPASGVHVRYTEPPAEADDAIVQRARQLLHDGRRPVTVVTDDRELSRRVRHVGASVESVDALGVRLRRLRVQPRGPVEAPEEEARLRALHERQERIAAHAAEQDRLRQASGTASQASDRQLTAREQRRLRGARRQARRLGQSGGGRRSKKRGRG